MRSGLRVTAFLVLLGAACSGSADSTPEPGEVPGIDLPEGFSITIWADDVPGARSLALGPDGLVFVGQRRSNGAVRALRDTDGDGAADVRYTVASGLNVPNGVAVRDGDLYIAEIDRILRIRNVAAHLEHPLAPEVVFDGLPSDELHGWKFIAFGPDGRLYVPVGAPCNVCRQEDPRYASILRLAADFSGYEVFASGVRNTVGFDWSPNTGELWFTDNGRDLLGDDLPPDELNRAPSPGLHFGFPFCHGDGIADPEFGSGVNCGAYRAPARALGPHVASLGMRFYTGTLFPETYRGGIFIAEHGSWNRSAKIGYRVTFVPLDGNNATDYQPFATGWLREGKVSGRPVDVLVMPDGALLVSDDDAGRVYRIAYRP